MRKLIVTVAMAAIASLTVVWAHPTRLVSNADMEACNRWVDSVYNSLTLRQRIAQLMFPKVAVNQGANTRAVIKRLVGEQHVGGLLFTEGSAAQYVEMTNYAQQVARTPVLMTFDGEWGLAMRVKDTPRFPQNMAIGAARDGERLAYEYGREMGRECRAAGIQVNFAPVADVNSNAANPIIGYRSFGEDPADVARLVTAYSRGLEDSGVQAVAKHFPGHGDAASDSHKTLPQIDRTAEQLSQVELVPFDRFIRDGGSGIMMAHLYVKALDSSGNPASLSAPAYKLLRDKMGFEGLVYTDALGMKGAVAKDGSNPTVAALKAGADALLSPRNTADDITEILTLVNSGKISKKTIEEHCKRVLTYKYILGLNTRPATLNTATVTATVNDATADAVNRQLSASVFTALVNRNNTLPISDVSDGKIAVVSLGAPVNNEFATMARRYADVKAYGSTLSAADIKALSRYKTVIVAVFNDKQATRATANSLASLRNVVSVFLVNPYKMAKMTTLVKASKAVILGYDDTPLIREYAAQAVFGGIAVDGRLPVTLKNLFKRGTGTDLPKTRLGYSSPALQGMDASLTTRVDSLMDVALTNGAIPGAQVLIARHGNVVLDKTYGKLTADGNDVDPFTVYDLASVSKAIGTLPGIMKAVDMGLMDIDKPLSDYVPGLRDGDKADITVRSFLFHETGMPASLNMFTTMMDTATYTGRLTTSKPDADHTIKIQNNVYGHRDAKLRRDLVRTTPSADFLIKIAEDMYIGTATTDTIMSRLYNAKLRPTPKYNYSCLNFALLMDGEQHVTGVAHDVWCDSLIWSPLGAWTMGYRAADRLPASQIAPTEKDNYLRRQTMHGYVHDEMACFSGGVQGNAGLFANADDIAKMCQMWLNGGTYGGQRILSPQTVELFTTTASPTCRRGLGFDKPDTTNPEYSPTTDLANASTYGHLGFTGTVFWVDPQNDMIFVFLTNRVNPTRDNDAFAEMNIRPDLMRMALESIKE